MDQLLPTLFIAIAALALCGAIYAVWQSLRGLFAAGGAGPADRPRPARAHLVDEKHALLQTLKDIRFERDLGKISDQDFDALNARYRARAKQVLRSLDEQLGPYRGAATSLLAEVTGPQQAQPEAPASAPAQAAEGRSQNETKATAGATLTCPACHHQNDPGAVFCNQCGVRLGGEAGKGADATGDEAGAEARDGGDTP